MGRIDSPPQRDAVRAVRHYSTQINIWFHSGRSWLSRGAGTLFEGHERLPSHLPLCGLLLKDTLLNDTLLKYSRGDTWRYADYMVTVDLQKVKALFTSYLLKFTCCWGMFSWRNSWVTFQLKNCKDQQVFLNDKTQTNAYYQSLKLFCPNILWCVRFFN